MPVQRLPDLATLAQPVYEISDEDRARQQRIRDAWVAYDGELDPPLKKLPDGTDNNVMTNHCKGVVNPGRDALFGKELGISVEKSAPAKAQQIIDKTWGRKEARIPLLQKLDMNGAMAGQAFLRIVKSGKRSFRLVVVDPSIVFVKTAPQDCETVLLYCIEYSVSEKVNGHPQQIFYREEIVRVDPTTDEGNDGYGDSDAEGLDEDVTWSIQHWSRKGERGQWTPSGAPIVWAYPFPPLFSNQNLPRPNDFWGYPDITEDIIGVNKALNSTESDIKQGLWFYGNPILYAGGVGQSVIDIKTGKIIVLPLPESKITAVQLHTEIEKALSFADDLRSNIDEMSAVPGVAIGRLKDMPRGTVSGVTIELLYQPLLNKTDTKRCTYGKMIIDVSKALLVLNGLSGEIDIELSWQSPLPKDDLGSVQTAVSKKEIGVSDQTLMRELGYDPKEELALSLAEDAQALEQAQKTATSFPAAVPAAPSLPNQPEPAKPGQPAPTSGGTQP